MTAVPAGLPPTPNEAPVAAGVAAVTMRRLRTVSWRAVPGDPVLRRGVVLLGLQVANVGLAYGTQVLLARWLGASEFGVFAYAWAWANLLAVPAGLGLATVVLRFVPTYAASGDHTRLQTLVRWSGRTVFVAGLVLGALGAAVAYALRDQMLPVYVVPLGMALVAVPFLALSTLQMNEGYGLGQPWTGYVPWILGSTVGVIAGVGVLVAVRARLDARSVLAVMLVMMAGVVFLQRRAVSRRLDAFPAACVHPESRRWLGVGAPMLLSALLYVLLERTDLLLVGTILGPSDAGIYGAAARTALLASLGVTAITTVASPRAAELHQAGKREELEQLATRVGHWAFWPAVAAAIALVALGNPILSLFGEGFRQGWSCLALLAVAQVVPASVGLAPHFLNMTGHEGANAKVMVVALLVCAGLAVVLIPRLGILGAALAASTGMVVRGVGHEWMLRRRLGMSAFVFARTGRSA